MTLTFIALLCLGLCRGPWDQVQADILPKPSIWADPGPIVSQGSPVTIWCQGTLQANGYILYRERGSQPLDRTISKASSNKTGFLIQSMSSQYAGLYQCAYSTGGSLSERSEPLLLVVTELCRGPWDQVQAGIPPKPSIWAEPGPVISKGSPVTIWCQGSLQADGYTLYKERGPEPWMTNIPETSSKKMRFLIESMSSQYAGLYQCAYSTGGSLSELSEPLLLVVTGEHSQPSLSAQPSPVVASGGNVSLLCSSHSTTGPFYLLKEGGVKLPQHRILEWRSYAGRWQAVFTVGPVGSSHGWGTYRCYGSSSSSPNVWSQPSDPLHLKVTPSEARSHKVKPGVYKEPSLSAQPGPLVLLGDSLTLQCHSEPGFDRFTLTKDEGTTPPQHLNGQPSPNFPLGPVNLTHGGRYRCYSGHNLSYVWSAPSAPLDILITAYQPQDYTVENLVRLGVSGLIFVVLGVLLLEAWHSQTRPQDAASG